MTINNIKHMYNKIVLAGLWVRPAEIVVSICPREYIEEEYNNM